MGDSESQQPISPEPAKPEGRNWGPMAIGVAVVVLLVGVFVVGGVISRSRNASHNDPYLSRLQVSNLHMATAENFAGGSVTYVEGTLTNNGDRKVTAASAEVIFKNSLGEISQKETLPITVLAPNSPYVDFGTLDRAPLAPGQARDFRLTLEYVTRDWDGQVPEVKVVSVGY
jgi:hypothetical protein